MTWVKLDDLFPEHPKVLEAGPVAAWLHVRAIAYCNRNLTDGFVSHAVLRSMAGTKSAVTLVKVGLWEKHAGGYLIHDYLHYQPSRQATLAKREQKKQAGRLGGLAKAAHAPSALLSISQQDAKQGASHGAKHSGYSERLPPYPYPYPYPSSERTSTPRGGRRGGLHALAEIIAELDAPNLDLVAMAQAAGDR